MLQVLFLVLAFQQPTPPAPPQPPDIQVVVKTVGKVGRYLAIKADTKGEIVLWKSIDAGIDFLDPQLSPSDTRTTGVIADSPGTYRLLALTAINNKPSIAEFSVTFEGKTPQPGPKPTPPPPGPGDSLLQKLQGAYDRDPAAPNLKAGHKALLVGLYEAMSEHSKAVGIKTTGELLADFRSVSGQMIAPTALVECRKVVAAEIAGAIGMDPASQLDPTLRPAAVLVFSRIAQAMAQVK